MADNLCLEEGLLVSASYEIPSDPAVYWADPDEHVACSHVICRVCGVAVRNVAGFALRGEPSLPAEYAAIFDAIGQGGDAPANDPWLTARLSGKHARVYACRCSAYGVAGTRTLRHHGPDDWTCGGHPA